VYKLSVAIDITIVQPGDCCTCTVTKQEWQVSVNMECQHVAWPHARTINEPHFPVKNRPRCYEKSPTAQDAFRPIPGLISCAAVTGRWGLLYHA